MATESETLRPSQRPRRVALGTMASLLVSFTAFAQEAGLMRHDLYLNYLGNAPYSVEANWTMRVNGLSHDEDHWYFSKKRRLFRVALSERIDRDLGESISIDAVPELDGFGHFGDISVFANKYVLVPVDTNSLQVLAEMAVFEAGPGLRFLTSAPIPGQINVYSRRGQAGFMAVDSQGRVYTMTSNGLCSTYHPEEIGEWDEEQRKEWYDRTRDSSAPFGSCIRRYPVNWSDWESGRVKLTLLNPEEIPLHDEYGRPLLLENLQGGVVTPSDRVIYLQNGLKCDTANAGIHAFDLETGRRLASSSKQDRPFLFEFDCSGKMYDEPEGLTIWDLDQKANPHGIRGQLHVFLMKNRSMDSDGEGQRMPDRVYFKHYTHRLHVDPAASGGDGTLKKPFGRFEEAVAASWSGATLSIRGGNYHKPAVVRPPSGHVLFIERTPGT